MKFVTRFKFLVKFIFLKGDQCQESKNETSPLFLREGLGVSKNPQKWRKGDITQVSNYYTVISKDRPYNIRYSMEYI